MKFRSNEVYANIHFPTPFSPSLTFLTPPPVLISFSIRLLLLSLGGLETAAGRWKGGGGRGLITKLL